MLIHTFATVITVNNESTTSHFNIDNVFSNTLLMLLYMFNPQSDFEENLIRPF